MLPQAGQQLEISRRFGLQHTMPDHEINDDKVAIVLEILGFGNDGGNFVDVHKCKALHFSILHNAVQSPRRHRPKLGDTRTK